MKHYSIDRWVDFSRDLVEQAERAAMQQHLESGCAKCQRTSDVMGKLAETTEADPTYEAPLDVLHRAKAIFSPRHDEPRETLNRVLAHLVYDSLRDPLPAGVRSGDRPAQALYEAADYSLDVHVSREHVSREHSAPRMVLVGQIADRREPGKWLADTPVSLKSDEGIAAQSVSNRFGEFHLEYAPQEDLQLEIVVDADSTIEVPLQQGSCQGSLP